MKSKALIAALALVTLVFTLAACGGGSSKSDGTLSRGDYEHQVNAIGGDLGDAVGQLSDVAFADDLGGIGTKLESVEVALGEAADELRALVPPADLASEHAALVAAFDDFTTGVAGLEKFVADAPSNPQAALDLGTKAIELLDMQQFESAIAGLQARGLEIG